jgi:hypothetical protein
MIKLLRRKNNLPLVSESGRQAFRTKMFKTSQMHMCRKVFARGSAGTWLMAEWSTTLVRLFVHGLGRLLNDVDLR